MDQPGYISGETLTEDNDPQRMFVITTWEDMESWDNWKESNVRKEFEAMLGIFQEGPTEYKKYLLGASNLE